MVLQNRIFLYVTFVLFFSSIAIQANATKEIKDLKTIDELLTTIDQSKKTPTLIYCYVDVCPHCKTFTPEFQAISEQKEFQNIQFTKAHGKKLNVHKIVPEQTKGKITVPGFPVVLFVADGQVIDILIGANPDLLKTKTQSFKKKHVKNKK